MEKIFEVKEVSKVFGETKQVQVKALTDIHLDINRGEFAALVWFW